VRFVPKYKAAVVQFEPVLFEKDRNIERLEALVEEAARNGARLVVTPEMATTRYCFTSRREIEPFVEPIPGPTTRRFGEIAARWSSYIVVGLPEVDEATGLFYNSAALVGPSGDVVGKYRKVHSFFDETSWAKDGDLGFPVFDTELGRIAMVICMDADFFESVRVAALKGADVVAFLTNWVSRAPARSWRCRALENGVYFLAADRWDSERGTRFGGGSCVIDPRGTVIAGIDRGDGVVYAEIDVKRARDKHIEGFGDLMHCRRPSEYHAVLTNSYLWQPRMISRLPGGRRSGLGIIQFVPEEGKPGANLARIAALLEGLCNAGEQAGIHMGLVVLPELCLTGIVPAVEMGALAEPIPGPSTERLAGLAAEFDAHLVVGIAERQGERVYNSAVLIGPDEVEGVYRKVHLNEYDSKWASGGDLGLPCFDIPAGRIGLLIGSEMMVPEVPRSLAKKGADVLAVPSAWPWMEWDFVWSERAANNDCYLALANQGGIADACCSVIYGNPEAREAAKLKDEEGYAFLSIVTEQDSFCRRKEMLRKVQPTWYDPIVREFRTRADGA